MRILNAHLFALVLGLSLSERALAQYQYHYQQPQQHQQEYEGYGYGPQPQLQASPSGTACSVNNGRTQPQNTFHYHAPARQVPVPPVDPEIRRQFLNLFHRDLNTNHTHGSPHDSTVTETTQPSPIDPAIIAQINALCPRDSFFYSFAPRHQNAITLLQNVFMNQTSATALLNLARIELYRHEINSRVWYYALLNTILARPDLNGLYLAWALDATPDLYLPNNILVQATEGSSRPQLIPAAGVCDANGQPQPPQQQQQQQQFPVQQRPSQFQQQPQQQFQQQPQQQFQQQPQQQFPVQQSPSQFQQQFQSQQSPPPQQRPAQPQQQQRFQFEQIPTPQRQHEFHFTQQAPPSQPQQQPQFQFQQQAPPPPTQRPLLSFPQPRPANQQGPGQVLYQVYQQPVGYSPQYLIRNKRSFWESLRVKRQFGDTSFPITATVSNYNSNRNQNYNGQFQETQRPSQNPGRQTQRPRQGQGQGQATQQRRASTCLPYNGTRGASGGENRLWYFREDVMINQHHWYWHLYYPQSSNRLDRPDRRGEVFYFLHHNIIARYNAERLSNGLEREAPLDLRLDGNIGAGYDSGLIDKQSERLWTPRVDNTLLSDINHQTDPDFQLNITMNEISRLYSTLVQHIGEGFLLANRSQQQGQPPTEFQLPIRNQEGLSHLGNTIEAAENLSTHTGIYHPFGVHNLGHISVALSSDPDFSCRRPTGVMADLTVTMRDPAFYKVHTFVDDLFDQYKGTLPPYHTTDGELALTWPGVSIQNLETLVGVHGRTVNHVKTFWTTQRFPLEEGLDGSVHEGDVEVDICHLHLNHEPFMFRLTVDVDPCVQTATNRGTVRIFMAPRFDLTGRRFTMAETRKLMFQLDHFPADLRPGRNIITRQSTDSSSTKPWSRSLQDMLRDPANGGQTEYCGCGWPQHMYIPKGTPQGMQFDIFAMITNYDQDQVQDTAEAQRIPEPCNSPFLFCGLAFKRYPDAKPLGYPFDRLPYSVQDGGARVRPVESLEEYVANVPNTKSSVITVQHVDTHI